jgi:transposase
VIARIGVAYYAARMADETLFPVQPRGAEPTETGAPRYETANRTQVELQPCDLEGLLPPGHAARLVWRFVEGLDLRAFYAAIRSREGQAGRPAIDPKILVALWLYATIDGVGSAREVDRLCGSHDAYRWLRGGVSVNYHTLSDFRVGHRAALDRLLTDSLTVLIHRGVVRMARVAQDGTRVRASASVGSFRRTETLQKCQRDARIQVARTAQQVDGVATARASAAGARAAAERAARVDEALVQLPEVAAAKTRSGRDPKEARTSTTDPDARIMKMSDGGFRPAYNLQFATDVESRVIVGVAVSTSSSDNGQLIPMLDQVEQRTGVVPEVVLADGGYANHATIDEATRRGALPLIPLMASKRSDGDTGPRRGDSLAVALWRRRMQTDAGKQAYKQRAAIAEWVHADGRTHRTLTQLRLRGRAKVHCWLLWAALAHNMLRAMGIVPHLMT